jgi:hypothetical protein
MTRTIRLQSDSNAHDRPWRVAVEQGFFAAEGLDVEYHEDNPKGTAGRVEDFAQRWKESQLQKGALEVYPVCEWGAIERVQALGGGKIIGLDTTVRTGALMVRKDSKIGSLGQLRNIPIAVTWHAGTFYAAIEALEAAGVPFADIKLVHANAPGGESPRAKAPRGKLKMVKALPLRAGALQPSKCGSIMWQSRRFAVYPRISRNLRAFVYARLIMVNAALRRPLLRYPLQHRRRAAVANLFWN